jgi:hypothetical protein
MEYFEINTHPESSGMVNIEILDGTVEEFILFDVKLTEDKLVPPYDWIGIIVAVVTYGLGLAFGSFG